MEKESTNGDNTNIIDMLSWNRSEKIQKEGRYLINQKPNFDYKTLILPDGRKDCWTECAVIICELDNCNIIKLLPDLFVWLQDMNWPGAKEISERLSKIPKSIISSIVEEAIAIAIRMDDEQWASNIRTMKDTITTNSKG